MTPGFNFMTARLHSLKLSPARSNAEERTIARWIGGLFGARRNVRRAPIDVSALAARRLVERGTQAFRELECIVIGPEVQEEQPRLLVEHVAVNRCHLDAVG